MFNVQELINTIPIQILDTHPYSLAKSVWNRSSSEALFSPELKKKGKIDFFFIFQENLYSSGMSR